MRIILGSSAVPSVDAHTVSYTGTTADPVPKAKVSFLDVASNINVQPMQELLILDEQAVPNTTANMLLNPQLNAGTNWQTFGTNGGLISFGVNQMTMTFSNAPVGYGYTYQMPLFGTVQPGHSYTLSAYVQSTATVNLQNFVQLVWGDAGGNGISNVGYQVFATTSLVRLSVTGIAPAGTTFLIAQVGGYASNATNSGTITFTQVQLEPTWFPDIQTYPTPWCGPNQTNCTQLPMGWWIRQHRKFGGLVNHAIAQDYHGPQRTWVVDGVGYAWIFSHTFTSNGFANQYDSAIIISLLSTYFPAQGGYTLFGTSGIVQGSVIAAIQSNWDDLRTLFDAMAAQSTFFWTVDPYWQFLYQPTGWTQMQQSLIVDNSVTPDLVTTWPVYEWQPEMDFTQPGASILVLGGNCTTTLTAGLTSGISYASLSVASLPAPITTTGFHVAGATPLIIGGNQICTLTANANAGDTTLSIQNNNNNANFLAQSNYGIGATVATVNPYVAQIIDPANSAIYNQALGSYGLVGSIFMRKLNDSTLQSLTDVTNRGIAELLQYDSPRFIYHGKTNVELVIGQSIQVTSAADGLNAQTLLVQQVQAQWLGTNQLNQDVWEYAFDFGPSNRSATSIMSNIFRKTTTSSAAPAITNTALLVLEKMNQTDTPQFVGGFLAGTLAGIGQISGALSVPPGTLSTIFVGVGTLAGTLTVPIPTILYGSVVADGTLTTACDMATAAGGSEISKTSVITGSGNYCEVWSQGTSGQAAVSAIPAPTGHGWVYKPGATTIPAGNWSAAITVSTTYSVFDLTLRFYKYDGVSTYTAIGSIQATGTTWAKTTYTFPATSMAATIFLSTDFIYTDLWYHSGGGVSGDNPTVYVSTSTSLGVANDMQITHP